MVKLKSLKRRLARNVRSQAKKDVSNGPYQVKVGETQAQVHPSQQNQASYLDTNGDLTVTAEEIVARTAPPSSFNYDKHALADYHLHSLTRTVPPQVKEYKSHDEINQEMVALSSKYPGQVHIQSLGQSHQGREIMAMRLGNGSNQTLITALSHAREWATGQVAMSAAEAKLHEGVPRSTSVWIVPVLNPDGYEYSRSTDATARTNANFVDLNRNYATNWRLNDDTPESVSDDRGASDQVGSQLYRGQAPLSEPENQAIANLIRSQPGINGWLDLHGFGELLIHPESERPEQYKALIADLNSADGSTYTGNVLSDYGDATGTAMDFGESLGILTVTAEIGQSFQPKGKKREQTLEDGIAKSLKFVEHMEQRAT